MEILLITYIVWVAYCTLEIVANRAPNFIDIVFILGLPLIPTGLIFWIMR